MAVARLRVFLNALAAEGIYANLNLHVGYQFRPATDGVPALPGGAAMPTQSKPLHIFWPRMVELQAEYTRKVLDALELRDDPVLAMVEIDNESSLVQAWQSNQLDAAVLGEYQAELQRRWNAWLSAKYADTAALRAAWGGGEADGPELLTPDNWRLEIHAPAQAQLAPGDPLQVTVSQGGAWVYAKQVGFSVTTDRPYRGEIEVRAALADGETRTVTWDVKEDVSPWRTTASRRLTLTNQWQKFTLAFQPTFAMDGTGRFAVDVGAAAGTYYVRNWSLKQSGGRGLAEDESLEGGGVALVSSSETSHPGTPGRLPALPGGARPRVPGPHGRRRARAHRARRAGCRHPDGLWRPAEPGNARRAGLPGQPLLRGPLQLPQTWPGTGATGASGTTPRPARGWGRF